MNEFETPADQRPVDGQFADVQGEPPVTETTVPHVVDPVRSAAGRLGAQRIQELVRLGRAYEEQHGLTPGRQRRRQLIQLGRRYEQEHGLRVFKPHRKARGDAWAEFVAALARVVKSKHRPAVDQLLAAMKLGPAPEQLAG
jgi:heme oxygenase